MGSVDIDGYYFIEVKVDICDFVYEVSFDYDYTNYLNF